MSDAPKSNAGRKKLELADISVDGWTYLDSLIIWGNESFCAEKLGVSEKTLQRRIREETGMDFDRYKHKKRGPMYFNLAQRQYEVAMGDEKNKPNPTMLIFLGKQYLGQSDKVSTSIEIEDFVITDPGDAEHA